ncbi:MAG: 2-hydroxyacyl-CoA dehydratase [Chloroflexi bacterium]|nr:2-hydroxyacyl-CoA dehydratase [Chloroflexota bacterium]
MVAVGNDRKAINRLQAMYGFRALVEDRYKRAIEASQSGQPIAWAMINWWAGDAILNTMDVVTVYPENYGVVCAATGSAQTFLARAEAEGYPAHLCGYARNCLGYAASMKAYGGIPPDAPMGGMAAPTLLLGSGGICDARYKWFQAMARYLDAPVWTLEMPHPGVHESLQPGAYEQNISFIVHELREFVAFLERLLGKKMDWDRLDETVTDMLETNRLWHEIMALRRARPCPAHSRDIWTCLGAILTPASDAKAALKLFHSLHDEIKHRVDNGIGAVPNEKYRLVFAELPIWHNLRFFDALAERGWSFVFESWAYHPPKPQDLSKVSDPLERIARHNYQWVTGYYTGAAAAGEWWGYFAYPYLELVRDYRCDGAFLHSVLSCRAGSTHLLHVRDSLMEKLKVPSLLVDGDMVDTKLFNAEDTLRCAETFEETMTHYREMRQKEGREW